MARLLIEIPDELYEEVKKDKYYKYGSEVWNIVKKGRVLPIHFKYCEEGDIVICSFDSTNSQEEIKYTYELVKKIFPNHVVIGITRDISIDTMTIEQLETILKKLKGESV